jgi:hypothetical protein
MAAKKKRKVGRPAGGPEKRDKRVTIVLTAGEHTKLTAEADALGVPLFLYGRWLLTRHPIPGEK